MNLKTATEIGKCLSNHTRFQILEWLKAPEKHFPPHETLKHLTTEFVSLIFKKKQDYHSLLFQPI